MAAYTALHVLLSLVGIGSGFVVLWGLLTARTLDRWSVVFLTTTLLTSLTGFGFPIERLLPSHVVGLISIVVLAVAIYARYSRHFIGFWRPTYVVTSILGLYLNVFVLIVQLFRKVPALKEMAPTQSEPPFQLTQLVVLAIFVGLGLASVRRFRPRSPADGSLRGPRESLPV